MKRRFLVAVVGDARTEVGDARAELAYGVGRALVDRGARVVTGGLGGVMEHALRGARDSERYREGDTIGILPGHDPADANPYVDIAVATGLDIGRNLVIANCDAVVCVGGGAGTLMELAAAWQLRRPIVACGAFGWSGELAGRRIDARVRQPPETVDTVLDVITAKATPAEAAEEAVRLAEAYRRRHRQV